MKISSNARRAGFAFSKRDDASSEIEKVDELIAGTNLKDNARWLGVWYSARVGRLDFNAAKQEVRQVLATAAQQQRPVVSSHIDALLQSGAGSTGDKLPYTKLFAQ